MVTSRRKRRKLRQRRLRLLGQLLFAGFGLWLGGFCWFVLTLPQTPSRPEGYHVDGIVVLTGGAGRIAAGVAGLEAGHGDRLLISGVNPQLANQTIRAAIDSDPTLNDCCIDLGRAALDTRGNAEEAAAWLRRRNFTSLEVITTDYHMRRALLEFSRQMPPGVRLHEHAVTSDSSLLRLALEYSKYLAALLNPQRLFGGSSTGSHE